MRFFVIILLTLALCSCKSTKSGTFVQNLESAETSRDSIEMARVQNNEVVSNEEANVETRTILIEFFNPDSVSMAEYPVVKAIRGSFSTAQSLKSLASHLEGFDALSVKRNLQNSAKTVESSKTSEAFQPSSSFWWIPQACLLIFLLILIIFCLRKLTT